jgi:predicted NBD/HSP70 family sugar kinase
MSDPSLLAGLDIGGSKVLAVAVDASGDDGRARVVEQVRLTTFQGPEGVVDTALRALTALAGKLVGHTGQPGGPATLFSGVGIGVPGLVDAERGAITHAVNLGVGTGGLALADRLRRRLLLPVVVENDVNAAALGAAAHLRLGRIDMAYLSIGTGLAAGIVLDGALRRGPHNASGEIGHIPVDLSGPVCGCGQRGCLEAVASGSAIGARWPASAGSDENGEATIKATQGPATALFAAASAGDPKAIIIRDEVAGYLAAAVRMLALTIDVDLVVLGGGVAEVGEPLRHAVASALDRQAESSAFLRGLDLAARLSVVPRDQPVAAVGAALLVRQPGPGTTDFTGTDTDDADTETAEDVPA